MGIASMQSCVLFLKGRWWGQLAVENCGELSCQAIGSLVGVEYKMAECLCHFLSHLSGSQDLACPCPWLGPGAMHLVHFRGQASPPLACGCHDQPDPTLQVTDLWGLTWCFKPGQMLGTVRREEWSSNNSWKWEKFLTSRRVYRGPCDHPEPQWLTRRTQDCYTWSYGFL